MRNRSMRFALPIGGTLVVLAALAAHPRPGEAYVGSGSPAPIGLSTGEGGDGCDILILWHTYRGEIDYNRSEVRVKGIPWVLLRGTRLDKYPTFIPPPPPETRTNGRIWNWKEELRQDRCDRNRRYRFRVVAPDSTGVPVRSNEPYAGTERWLYFPSTTGWTQKTTIDVGYLDWCVVDGTKCAKPYYPSGPTPVLQW